MFDRQFFAMTNAIREFFLRDEEGQTAVEYILLLSLITVPLLGIAYLLNRVIFGYFDMLSLYFSLPVI